MSDPSKGRAKEELAEQICRIQVKYRHGSPRLTPERPGRAGGDLRVGTEAALFARQHDTREVRGGGFGGGVQV